MSTLPNKDGVARLVQRFNDRTKEPRFRGWFSETNPIEGWNQPNRRREKYFSALKSIPAPGTGCHPYLMTVSNLGVAAGLTEHEIIFDIRLAIPPGKRAVSDREIATAVSKATQSKPGTYRRSAPTPALAAKFDGVRYRQTLIARGDGASEYDLWEASPVRIDWDAGWMDAFCVLETLYRPDEFVFIGDKYDASVDTAVELAKGIESSGIVPPHIACNPFSGAQHTTGTGKPSYRCDDAVAAYRFALVEFDGLSMAEQYAYWHAVLSGELLPVSCIIDSGGKSLHAWIRVDLPDRAAWDEVVRNGMFDKATGLLSLQGVDAACRNPSRLSRLPGHDREGRLQRLLYLNPKAGRISA